MFRRHEVRVLNSGSYVMVYQRTGQQSLLDINFFDGDRSVSDAENMKAALEEAIQIAKTWSK